MVEGGGGPRGVQKGYILDWGRVSPKKNFRNSYGLTFYQPPCPYETSTVRQSVRHKSSHTSLH